MKGNILTIISVTVLLMSMASCADDLLEKPMGTDLNVDSIFSTEQKALSAISQSYANSLASGIAIKSWDGDRTYGLIAGTISGLSGEINVRKFNWEDQWIIQRSGMTADDGNGRARSDDGFMFNYTSIRQCYLVIENIDKVVDMSEQDKEIVKAEMKTLIAYRYLEMFKRYGGIPIVEKSMGIGDELKIPRASLQEVQAHIEKLCDEAYPILPDKWPSHNEGRVTKGVTLAIKAETYIYAARPLFNSSTPYLSLGEYNNLISFGNEDPARWQKAIDASEDVISWALSNGYEIINTGSPLDDYGTAVATPGNRETLLAYKNQTLQGNNSGFTFYHPYGQSGGANGMSFYQLSQYKKADGTEQDWPALNEKRDYDDYYNRIQEMEPRYKASAMGAGIDAWNNPNDVYWSSANVSGQSNWEGVRDNEACGRRVKFWYHAGRRFWFEFPIYRLAEFYLNLAEAYNEIGNTPKALENLKVITDRAGLPPVTETDKVKLRKIIQREWAVEFYDEGHRLYDVKHWKLENIGDGIIGGDKQSFIFTYVGNAGYVPADYVSYSVQTVYRGFWSPNQYLNPFPNTEVNKGYLVQNPGY